MKLRILSLLLLFSALLSLFSGCGREVPSEQTLPALPPPVTVQKPPRPPIQPLPPEIVLVFSPEEKEMLLKLGMAELGNAGCTECVALVMCTVLNRVEAERFGSSIQRVILAPEQFTPVMTGAYNRAKPNDLCYDAYEMVIHGWYESQGALYYEFCEGESWHSKNLHLLFQHCDVRFYD